MTWDGPNQAWRSGYEAGIEDSRRQLSGGTKVAIVGGLAWLFRRQLRVVIVGIVGALAVLMLVAPWAGACLLYGGLAVVIGRHLRVKRHWSGPKLALAFGAIGLLLLAGT